MKSWLSGKAYYGLSGMFVMEAQGALTLTYIFALVATHSELNVYIFHLM